MIAKRIINPPFFVYSLFHYFKCEIPFLIALCLRSKDSYLNEIVFFTYDGSNQVVHPDCIYLGEKYWVAVTPYPFGLEEYENPSIYTGEKIENLFACNNNPIKKPHHYEFGCHLSDPCLCNDQEYVYCIYRDTKRKADGSNWNGIYIMKCSILNECWEVPKLLLQSDVEPILTPAVVITKDQRIHMFHVNANKYRGKLMYTVFNRENEMLEQKELICKGIPENYFIWHIGISFEGNLKFSEKENKLNGLFLVRNIYEKSDFRLYTSLSILPGMEWSIEKRVNPPEEISKKQIYPYKSSFIPNSTDILYGFKDKKNRFRIVKMKMRN